MSHASLKTGCKLVVALGMVLWLWLPLRSAGQNPALTNRQTFDPAPEWRPTHAPANARYAGNAACAECHDEVLTQPATPMGKALVPAAESRILRQHPHLSFKEGPYTYSITRRGDQSFYSVTDGKESISLPIPYGFGQGKVGQTYVLEYQGKYYESRVSFYRALGGLDFTLGASKAIPGSLEAALGRLLDKASVNDCFSCHATRPVAQGQLELSLMTPGITCEGCHGPGERHIAAMRTPGAAQRDRQIFNPGLFDTEGMTQFCGACHRSWIQVQMLGIRGVENVRFQPYRLFNSKCYDHRDKRISCLACHNPHEELETEAGFYDQKCTACHQTGRKAPITAKSPPACPKAGRNCAACHMPKVELPGAHHQFTDHQIRVVRKNAPYPN
ncbi:MAG: multiheme c-type cytochrome [Blastocatellia bacterium]